MSMSDTKTTSPGQGQTRMIITDETGRDHLVDFALVRTAAAELEAEGVVLDNMRADRAARLVLARIERNAPADPS